MFGEKLLQTSSPVSNFYNMNIEAEQIQSLVIFIEYTDN